MNENTTILTRTIQRTNRSGTFSSRADYTPLHDGRVQVDDWTFDELGHRLQSTESGAIVAIGGMKALSLTSEIAASATHRRSFGI